MFNAYLFFDPDQETLDGKGWTVNSYDDALDEPIITTVTYLTITAALNAIKALFNSDAAVNAYFQEKAEAAVLAANAAAVTTQKTTYMTGEGLP